MVELDALPSDSVVLRQLYQQLRQLRTEKQAEQRHIENLDRRKEVWLSQQRAALYRSRTPSLASRAKSAINRIWRKLFPLEELEELMPSPSLVASKLVLQQQGTETGKAAVEGLPLRAVRQLYGGKRASQDICT